MFEVCREVIKVFRLFYLFTTSCTAYFKLLVYTQKQCYCFLHQANILLF